jgi:hypothetical protein
MSTIPVYMTRKGELAPGHGIVKTGTAAVEVPFNTVVGRSADGTIKPLAEGAVYSYLGVAVDDKRKQIPYDGFYAAGKKVPYVADGVATVLLMGGLTVNSGDYVKNLTGYGAGTETLGVVMGESAATRTLYSIGRVIDANDVGNAAYDQPVYESAAGAISGDIVTFGVAATKALLELKNGDVVVIDSDTYAEVNVVKNADYSSTAVQMVKNPLPHHATSIMMYKLLPIQVELI